MESERHSVRIVLLNENNEVLLMKADDPGTTDLDGTNNGPFWVLVGGEVESGETLEQTVYRELFEETGLQSEDVDIGPIIWYGDFWLILSGQERHMQQRFVLARAKNTRLSLAGLTEEEKKVVQAIEWFSLEKMQETKDIIYPVGLVNYLAPILAGNIPDEPVEIALDRKPIKSNQQPNQVFRFDSEVNRFIEFLRGHGLGLRRRTVGLVEYNLGWENAFLWVADQIKSALPKDFVFEIQHVGSTSIAGLCAKPILDILLTFADADEQVAAISFLKCIGFLHKGDGVARVERSEPDPRRHFYSYYDVDLEVDFVHLHTYVADHYDVGRLLRFRDCLRGSVEVRDRYAQLKREMYSSGKIRREYTLSKRKFIDSVLGEGVVV